MSQNIYELSSNFIVRCPLFSVNKYYKYAKSEKFIFNNNLEENIFKEGILNVSNELFNYIENFDFSTMNMEPKIKDTWTYVNILDTKNRILLGYIFR